MMGIKEAKAVHRRIELAIENSRKLGFKLHFDQDPIWRLERQNPKIDKIGTTLEHLEWFLEGMIFQVELQRLQKEKWL